MSGYNASPASVLSFILSTMPMKDAVRSGHDAFDTLPDSLLAFILSKMPLKDAVRSSILSKRWRFLYTRMPELTFPELTSSDTISRDENIISNMLLQHSGDLEGFHLDSIWPLHYSTENVCKWVEYASQRKVLHLTLSDRPTYPRNLEEIPALFSCSRLVKLLLRCYILTSFPTDFAGFPHLISCYLYEVHMTDESLASLVSLCPLLQKLEMTHCFGLGHAVIFSSSIEHLNINFPHGVESVLVDCPKLKILKAFMIRDLSVNAALFYELSFAVSYLKMHCGDTLRELELDSEPQFTYHRPPPQFPVARRFLDILGNFQSLKKLIIVLENEENGDFPLFKLFHRLPNLQMFSVLGLSFQGMAIPVFFTPPHLNLKKISIGIFEFGHKEVEIISCLLQSTPSLEALEIQLPDEYEYDGEYDDEYDESQFLKFLEDIRLLRRASLFARVIVLDRNSKPIHVLGCMPTPSLSK